MFLISWCESDRVALVSTRCTTRVNPPHMYTLQSSSSATITLPSKLSNTWFQISFQFESISFPLITWKNKSCSFVCIWKCWTLKSKWIKCFMLLCLQFGFWWSGALLFSVWSLLILLKGHTGFKCPLHFYPWWEKTKYRLYCWWYIFLSYSLNLSKLSPKQGIYSYVNKLSVAKELYCFHFHMFLQFILIHVSESGNFSCLHHQWGLSPSF